MDNRHLTTDNRTPDNRDNRKPDRLKKKNEPVQDIVEF